MKLQNSLFHVSNSPSESYKQTQDRVQVNLAEKIDLLRAEYALENAQQFWQSQNARLKSVQAKFSSRLDNPNLRQVTPQFNLYEMVYIKNPSYIIISNLRRIKSFKVRKKIVLQKQLSMQVETEWGSFFNWKL